MSKGLFVSIAALAMVSATQVGAQDADVGEKLYKKSCRSCHGPTAKGMASFPKLAGNTEDYLVERLNKYRAGEKVGPNTALMVPRAKNLSDDDITNIVTFIVSISP
ncbi:c-type cytochrome [uncultured Roseibium sp.]|uniref:c-type cytochrome n=1 Tax=uncultured Roseibium sp. TaxID=1936171 RepID=UPI00261BE357|nr:c-type cytochrome [uncultured Roseibium sp.]